VKAFPFPAELLPDVRRWKDDRKAKYVAEHGEEAFRLHREKVLAWHRRHHWHPHQLRHAASTRVARKFGEITSQNLLGHTSLKTTSIYTERDWGKAEEAMALIG
jgi:integrase